MSGKPTSPVTKTDETESKTKTISQMVPGSLNKYNTLNNHIIMNVGTFDKFTDVVSEVIYRNTEPTQLAGMNGPFQGIVLQVIAADPAQRITSMLFGRELKLLKLKVRVPELHVSLPIPSKEEMEAAKNNTLGVNSTIEFYPVFIAQDEEISKKIPNVGDIVWVTFKNIEQQSGGIYLGAVAGATSIGVQSSSGGVLAAVTEGAAKASSNANGEIGTFNYKKKLESTPKGVMKGGNLLYALGSGSPMILGIQSALGQPATGVLDSATLDKIKTMRSDGYIGAGELIKLYGDKFPFFLRVAEYTQNNESGGHRMSPGVALNYWTGRTNTEERNVVEFDMAGNNYGILGLQIDNFGTGYKKKPNAYQNPLMNIKSDDPKNRPPILVQNWRTVNLSVLDEDIINNSSLATVLVKYGGDSGKQVWKDNRLEVYAQRLIHSQIAVGIRDINRSSYSETEKKNLKNMLRKLLDEQINPIPAVSQWLSSLPGIQAQIVYFIEKVFIQGINFALAWKDYTIPVITTASDITAGGNSYGASFPELVLKTKNIKVTKDRRVAWIDYVDGKGGNLYGSGKKGRHLAPINGTGAFVGTAIYMDQYGLTEDYINKPIIRAELDFWQDYSKTRARNLSEARTKLKAFLQSKLGWELTQI